MRCAVVGLGAMGMRHVDAVLSLGWTLDAGCDARPETLTALQQKVPTAAVFADYAALLERSCPEVIIIATTAPSHVPLAAAALQASVPYVLIEKPLATSLAAAHALTIPAGSRVAVNHPMRFMPIYAEPIAWVTHADRGGFRSLQVTSGAGGWAMIGSHFLEAFRLAAQMPIQSVRAHFDETRLPNPRGPEFEDRTGQVFAETAGGHRFSLEMGGDLGHGIHLTFAARYGMVHVDLLAGTYRTAERQPDDRDLPVTRYGTPAVRGDHQVPPADPISASAAMLQALVKGDPVTELEDATNIVAALAAAYVSDETGQMVDVSEAPPEREFAWA